MEMGRAGRPEAEGGSRRRRRRGGIARGTIWDERSKRRLGVEGNYGRFQSMRLDFGEGETRCGKRGWRPDEMVFKPNT